MINEDDITPAGIAGGQGRTGQEIEDACSGFGRLCLWMAVGFVVTSAILFIIGQVQDVEGKDHGEKQHAAEVDHSRPTE